MNRVVLGFKRLTAEVLPSTPPRRFPGAHNSPGSLKDPFTHWAFLRCKHSHIWGYRTNPTPSSASREQGPRDPDTMELHANPSHQSRGLSLSRDSSHGQPQGSGALPSLRGCNSEGNIARDLQSPVSNRNRHSDDQSCQWMANVTMGASLDA